MSQELFDKLEKQYGLPPGLLNASMMAESGGNVNAVSPRGATGAFQFMPATAQQYGVNPHDLVSSATGAAQMYADLLKQNGGDLNKAIAGFNWGQGNVQRKGMTSMPTETRNHIQKVTANMGKPQTAGRDYSAELFGEETSASPSKGRDYSAELFGETTPEQVAQPQQQAAQAKKSGFMQGTGNAMAGLVRGMGSIGSTLLLPADKFNDLTLPALPNGQTRNQQRRADMDAGLRSMGAQPDSLMYQGGKIVGEITGTAGAPLALARGASAVPSLARFAPALASGGFKVAAPAVPAGGKLTEAVVRTGAGALGGATMAGMVNPYDMGTGAAIGAAMPGAFKVAGETGMALNKLGKAAANKTGIKIPSAVSQEVKTLYKKAKSLGIEVPLDRVVDNRPLNAAAASLNYVPLSGRMAREDKMLSQFNRAVSRSFGQDSDNVTGALRKASSDLGKKFDDTLQNNSLIFDNQLLDDLSRAEQAAINELDDASANVIKKQIDTILGKVGQDGKIDGQTAYNVKKTLDRIGNRSTNEAYYARDIKKSLMGALNRSMGPDKAAEFSKVRQQYGNMLDLEGLAQNGAEGGVSVARLANMKNINNNELQDLADIAAQFLRTRESPHGAAQRVGMLGLGAAAGGTGLATGTLPFVAAVMAGGRAANTALNSNTLKNAIINRPELYRSITETASNPLIRNPAVLYGQGLLNYSE